MKSVGVGLGISLTGRGGKGVAQMPTFIAQPTSGQILKLTISSLTTETVLIMWGDGAETTVPANTSLVAYTHTYTVGGNFPVNIGVGCTYLKIEDVLVSGDIAGIGRLENLTYFRSYSNNTFSGNVSSLPQKLETIILYGSNTMGGNVKDIPRSVVGFYVQGSNTICGDVSDLPSGLVNLTLYGNNTLDGELSDLPSTISAIYLSGDHTIHGAFANVGSSCRTISITGGSISSYSSVALSAKYMVKIIPSSGGMPTSDIDQLLIDLSGIAWGGGKTITLTGSNSARSSASDDAISTLGGLGVTVVTN